MAIKRNKIAIAKADISRIELPEGYKVVREKTKAERVKELQAEIDSIERERGNPPTDEELIEFAKMMHPYYQHQERIDWLNEQIKKWQTQ